MGRICTAWVRGQQGDAATRAGSGRPARLGIGTAIRAAALLGLSAAIFASAAASSSAVVVQLPSGKRISYQPTREIAQLTSLFSAPSAITPAKRAKKPKEEELLLPLVKYNGGPIMRSNTNYTLYWDPKGGPAYPAGYQSGINRYLEDLAHDSGGKQNVDSVAAQYYEEVGGHGGEKRYASYASKFAGQLIDEDPYPTNGCKQAPICLSGEQLETEIAKYVHEHHLPEDLEHEYFLLTPPGVEDCAAEEVYKQKLIGECSAGAENLAVYCAYHDFIKTGSSVIVYANDPFVAENEGCENNEHPNASLSDGELQGGLSHEHNESITDPTIEAWFGEEGNEIGDKCRTFREATEFGTPLGEAPDGSKYNQVINGHFYYYQQEFSNEGDECLQRAFVAPPPPKPVVIKVLPSKGTRTGGTHVTIRGEDFTEVKKVKFGSEEAKEFTAKSSESIEAVSPALAKGTYEVTVTTAAGTSTAVKKDKFKVK